MCQMTKSKARPRAVRPIPAPAPLLTAAEVEAVQAIARRALARSGGWEADLYLTVNVGDGPDNLTASVDVKYRGVQPRRVDFYQIGDADAVSVDPPTNADEFPLNEFTLRAAPAPSHDLIAPEYRPCAR